jgi:hypothetical protein
MWALNDHGIIRFKWNARAYIPIDKVKRSNAAKPIQNQDSEFYQFTKGRFGNPDDYSTVGVTADVKQMVDEAASSGPIKSFIHKAHD